MDKIYIGDGAYVERDEFGNIVLTTENGVSVTNRIVLEDTVLVSLLRWLRDVVPGAFDI